MSTATATTTSTKATKKTTCPVTRQQFTSKAKPVAITINGRSLEAKAKQFSTGSMGWHLSDKCTVLVDGVAVLVQVGLNLTVVGSKDLPETPEAAQEHAA